MAGERGRVEQLHAKRREQTPQALARLVVVLLFIGVWFVLLAVRIPMPTPFLVTLLLEATFFIAYWRLVSILPNARSIEVANYGMLAAEIVFHTTMVYFLGGISWLGAFAYVFGLVFTNTFLDLKRGLVYTLGAATAFVSMILLDATGVIPHQYYLAQDSERFRDAGYVATTIIGACGVFVSLHAWVNWVGHQIRQERDTAVRAQEGLLQAQAELWQANDALEARVSERTAELELLNSMLRESEERLRAVVTNAPIALLAIDRHGVFTLCEGRALADLGIQPELVRGRSAEEVFRTRPDLLESVQRALAGESVKAVIRGERWVLESQLVPLRDAAGVVQGVIGVGTNITERTQAEEALRASEERLRTVVSNAPVVLWSLDATGTFTLSEGRGLELLGLKPGEVVGQSVFDVYRDAPDVLEHTRRALAGEPFAATVQVGALTFESHYMPLRGADGAVAGVIGVAIDVTETKRTEEALRESEAKFRAMAETVAAATFIYQGTQMRYVNSAALAMTGYSRDELLAMRFWEVIHPDFQEWVRDRGMARQSGEQVPNRYEVKIRTKSGEARWVDFTAGGIEFDGQPAVLGTAFDITERKRAEEALEEQARRDPLTGLLNRRAGLAAIEERLQQARLSGSEFAVLVLDIDHFKAINDSFGHEAGDDALKGLADVLLSTVARRGVVCRLGGDEFEIGLMGAGLERARAFADDLRRVLHATLAPAGGEALRVTVGIGIATFPFDATDLAELARRADRAMYAAKAAGGDGCRAWRELEAKAA
jgi:diguanylate cyclase (GGDEF)-like protein/PAS domain S-box-containing protein